MSTVKTVIIAGGIIACVGVYISSKYRMLKKIKGLSGELTEMLAGVDAKMTEYTTRNDISVEVHRALVEEQKALVDAIVDAMQVAHAGDLDERMYKLREAYNAFVTK